MMNIRLLDCTLRDGGYVNNWRFSREQYETVVTKLNDANVDCIELGIMGSSSEHGFSTKFRTFGEIPVPDKKRKAVYTVMITVGESDAVDIPAKTDQMDGIRLAFFKADIERALKTARKIKEKGYSLYMQAMATFMYEDAEFRELIQKINELQADVFYMVDSFGTMYQDEVIRMADLADKTLDKNIGLGFHAHNNRQMAFANDIAFIESLITGSSSRDIYVDATVFGMGRGAGNTAIELIAEYLNEKQGGSYDIGVLTDIYDLVIKNEYENNCWGYSMDYSLTSRLQMNAAYIWYIKTVKNITDYKIIKKIAEKIPAGDRYTLRKDVVNRIIEETVRQEQ